MTRNRPALALVLLLASFLDPKGLHARPAETRAETTLQVRAKELWVGDGRKIANGVLVIEDGRIDRVGEEGELDPRLPTIEHDGVVTAGMVACQTRSGTTDELLEDARSVIAEARAAFEFDPDHPDFRRALEAGITTALLVPSGENLVGGLASAVKTSGGEIVERDACLAISFSGNALGRTSDQNFFFFQADEHGELVPGTAKALEVEEVDPASTEAGGPEPTVPSRRGTRQPTSYSGALAELRARFTRPTGVFESAADRDLPVLLEAWERNEVVRAADFAREHELAGAILGAPLASDPDVRAAIARSGLGVILGPYVPGQARRSLESVKELVAAKVPVAFALGAPAYHPDGLRLSAALAIGAGADEVSVWKALTSDAARLANVAERVGSLEEGKDADFVLWTGDPLSLSSAPVAVYVGGRLAWQRAERGEPLARERWRR